MALAAYGDVKKLLDVSEFFQKNGAMSHFFEKIRSHPKNILGGEAALYAICKITV
jgi:hypothetical protein